MIELDEEMLEAIGEFRQLQGNGDEDPRIVCKAMLLSATEIAKAADDHDIERVRRALNAMSMDRRRGR